MIYNECNEALRIVSDIVEGKFVQEPIKPLNRGYPTAVVANNVSEYNYS